MVALFAPTRRAPRVAFARQVAMYGRDDISLDCRLEALELFCRTGLESLRLAMPESCR